MPDRAVPRSRARRPSRRAASASAAVTYDHLPVAECGNFWMENDQANTLAGGDVSKYSLSVDWAALAAGPRRRSPSRPATPTAGT